MKPLSKEEKDKKIYEFESFINDRLKRELQVDVMIIFVMSEGNSEKRFSLLRFLGCY